MQKRRLMRHLTFLLVLVMVFAVTTISAFATTVSVLDGTVSVTDTANSISASGNTVTVKAKGGLSSPTTNTITITNSSGSTALISFGYSASNYSSFSKGTASGTVSQTMDAGATYTMSITGNKAIFSNTATLTLSNISCAAVQESATITVTYGSLGSVKMDGATVASGSANSVGSAGSTFVATPVSGAKFVAWINTATNDVITTSASYTLTPTGNAAIRAVFANASSAPVFWADGTAKLYESLDAALRYASSASNKVITLASDGTLPAGNYTIPAGVTLLIPFDDANTLYTTEPAYASSYTKPTAYRTLTMADGAEITVNGAISVSGQHRYVQGSSSYNKYGGAPTGKVGFIQMEGTSSIKVNSGGTLYCYGFITGSGSVTAYGGSSIYENIQITDYRGGDQSLDSGMKTKKVFPVSQYYVQNIEVPLTLHSGAEETVYTHVYASSMYLSSATSFLGNSDSMFNISSGYVTKWYDGSTDRLNIDIYGDATMESITLKLGVSLGGTTVNSADYVLPVNGNITVTVKSGSEAEISQDVAMIPGSQLVIEENATLTLGSGVSAYVYDGDTWGNNYCHGPRAFAAAPYAPSRTYTRTAKDLVDAAVLVNGTFNASDGYLYTTYTTDDPSAGANIYSTGTGQVKIGVGTGTVTYWLADNTTYVDIPITPAKLKNENGEYVETSGATTGTTYNYAHYTCEHEAEGNAAHGMWFAGTHQVSSVVTNPTCTAAGYTTHTCIACGHSYTDTEEDALGHRYGNVTYSGDGKTSYTAERSCSCGDKQTATAKITSATTAATCTVKGETVYTAEFTEDWAEGKTTTEEISAIAHKNKVHHEKVDATCVATGTIEYWSCPDCGKKFSDEACTTEVTDLTIAIDSDNHVNKTEHGQTDATCTEVGYTAGTYCEDCKTWISGHEEISASGHSHGEPQFTWNGYECSAKVVCHCSDEQSVDVTVTPAVTTTATCTVAGVCTYTATAVYNGTTYTDTKTENLGVDSANHVNTTEHSEQAPTCTEKGYTAGTYCEDCKTWISGHEEIPAAGHSYGDWSRDATNHWRDCTVCGEDADVGEHAYVDGTCVCGAVEDAGEQEPVATTNNHRFGYQVGLIEPWFLRINFLVQTSAGVTINPSSFEDYGAYAIRMSNLGNAEEVIKNLNYDAIINNPEMTAYTKGKEVSVHEADNRAMFESLVSNVPALSFRYRESIYTYEMSDPIVYFCWYVDAEGLHYSPIKQRSISDLINERKTDVSFAIDERAVYEKMSKLEEDVITHRGNGETTLPNVELYTVAQSELGTPVDSSGYQFLRTKQIVLIEPWGLRINALVRNGSTKTTLNYSSLDDYGIVVYHAKDNVIPEGAAGMLGKADAYVFSKEHGNTFTATVSGQNAFCARYRNEIYTYELDSTICYMYYIKVGGNYYYSDVYSDNIKALAVERAEDTSGSFTETEQAVYKAMIDLYDAITPYRAERI